MFSDNYNLNKLYQDTFSETLLPQPATDFYVELSSIVFSFVVQPVLSQDVKNAYQDRVFHIFIQSPDILLVVKRKRTANYICKLYQARCRLLRAAH